MAKKKMKNKIVYGDVELPEGFDEPKNARILISIRVDGDVLEAFKRMAHKQGKKYQALMHETLAKAAHSEGELSDEMKREIADEIRKQLGLNAPGLELGHKKRA